jgi:ferrous iron transport protein B
LIIPLIFAGALQQGLALFGIYALGTITALVAAKFLKPSLGKTEAPQFLLELPPYQKPRWTHVLRQVGERAFAFIKKAGTVILGLSIILWFLESYPKSDSDDPIVQQSESFNGQIGEIMEPVVTPLGWDARMGTAMMASFAAREVFRSSLAISYATDEEDGEEMRDKLTASTRADGTALYTPLVGLSIIVFFVYALQCLPTTVVVRRETGSWKWAIGQLAAMTVFAYLAALVVYQTGKLLGYS